MSQHSCQTDSDYDGQDYLSAVRSLSLELTAAIIDLAADEIGEFRKRVDLLEYRCACLQQAVQKTTPTANSSNCRFAATRSLADQIDAAHLELGRARYRFSALLRRRWRTVNLLSRHYRPLSRGIEVSSAFPHETSKLSAEV